MKIPAAIANPCTAALNWIQGKREPTRLERLQMAVTTVAKVILSGLIISGITYGMGSAMMYAGTTLAGASTLTTLPAYVAVPLEYCGAGLLHSGTAVAAFGRGVFLGITAPLYAVCYEAPQVIYAHALPFLNASVTCIATVATQAFHLLNQTLAIVAEGIYSLSSSVYTVLQPYLHSIASTISTIANSVWSGFVSIADQIASSLHPIVSQVTAAVSSAVLQVFATLHTLGQQIATGLGTAMSSIWGTVYTIGQQVTTALSPYVASVANTVTSIWVSVYDAAASAGYALYNHASEGCSAMQAAICTAMQTVSTTFTQTFG